MLLLVTYVFCVRKGVPALPASAMWQAAGFALLICLLHARGGGEVVKHPEIFLMTFACLCLLWAALGRLSLLLWVPFLVVEATQAVAVRLYYTGFNSFVIAEILGTSKAEVVPFLTWRNVLALLVVLGGIGALAWLLMRVMRRTGRWIWLRAGVLSGFFAVCMVWLVGSREERGPLALLWPVTECERLVRDTCEARHTKDDLIRAVAQLPSPALKPSSCNTVTNKSGVIVVLHIGESVRADEMSINGYSRDTTPWLRRNREVINFPDCISAWMDTPSAQAVMLTNARRRIKNAPPGMRPTTGSFIDLFAEHGFEVHCFLGNLAGLSYTCDRIMRLCVRDAKSMSFAKGGAWSSVPQMAEVLQKCDAEQPGQNLFFFVNNEGSHFPFGFCDREHPPFAPIRADHTNAAAHAQEVLNAYDSTIHYTDEFWRRVNELLEGRPFVYIYVSDHGEYIGHDGIWVRPSLKDREIDYHSTTGCRVGAFVIASPEFRALHPHFEKALEQLRIHTRMTIGHEHLFHTMLGLFDIRSPYYEARLDLCSPQAQPYTGPQPSTPAQRAPEKQPEMQPEAVPQAGGGHSAQAGGAPVA